MALIKNNHGDLIDGVAANAAAASRTAILSKDTMDASRPNLMQQARKVGISARLTRVAATAFTLQVYKSCDDGASWSLVRSMRSNGDGSYEALAYSVSDTNDGAGLAADSSIWLSVDMEDANALKVVASATTGGASDLIYVGFCTSAEV